MFKSSDVEQETPKLRSTPSLVVLWHCLGLNSDSVEDDTGSGIGALGFVDDETGSIIGALGDDTGSRIGALGYTGPRIVFVDSIGVVYSFLIVNSYQCGLRGS